MTGQGADVIDVLKVIIEADRQRLTQGLAAAVQESRQAGQQMGQGLRSGLSASVGGLGSVGTQAGQQLGEGITRGADGRLRDARGKFVKAGQDAGQGFADGVKQASPAVDSAVTGLTSALSGGGAGGGIGAAFGRLTAGAGGLSASLTGIVGVAGPAGAAIASVGAAAAAVVAPVNAAINVFAEFEYGLAKVSTLTDKTPQQLRGTGQEILRLSAEMGASFQSLNAGLYDILGAGVAGTESMAASLKFLEQAAKLAKAGATDTAVATDVLTSVMNAYKLSAEDAGDVSDKLFKAVDLGKMSFEQLAQSLGMVTAISSQAGVSLDEVLAALSTMTANGVQASSAVDYLRSMISAITKPSKEASGLAEELGIAFNEQALKGKGLTGVLQEVIAKTGGSTEKMGVLFGGVEAVTAATSIASGEFKRMGENIAAIGNSSGTTEVAYGKMASTVQAENDKLKANWERLMAGMGEVFAPFKVDVLSGLNELLNKANEVLEKWMQAKRLKSSGQDVMNLERQLEEQQSARQNAYARLRDPNVDAAEKARIREDFLPQILAEIGRLKRLIAEAKAEDAALRAEEYAANGGTFGPQPGGTGGGAASPDAYDAATNSTAYQGDVVRQSIRQTGVRTADEVVNYCAQWVRLTLGKADQRVAGYVNSLFQKDRDGNGEIDARDAAAGVKAAGLMRDYKGVSDLKPGDTVFYTEGGQNHVGIYIGGGMVRGNNRVTYAANGGKFDAQGRGISPGVNPVGNVNIDRLGRVTGYMSASDLGRAAGLVQSPKPTATGGGAGGGDEQEGPITAAQIVKAQQLLAAVEKAKKAMQAKPGDNGLKIAYDAASQALANWTKESKENARAAQAVRDSQTGAAKSASGTYIATSADLRRWGADALRLIKDLDKARASGSAQAIATAEQNIATWVGESKARQAVLTAETAAYRARQQQAEDARRQAERDGAPARTQAEIRAQEKLEKALRNASRARLEQLANGTVGENGLTLEKWKAARAEIERRDRLDDQADKDSRARTQRRAELERQISAEVTAGKIADAQRTLAALKRSQQEELDAAGDNAAKRAAIIEKTAPAILAAERSINAKVRNQAIQAAQAWADEQTKLGVLSADKIEKERVRRVRQAYAAEAAANDAAQAEITRTTEQAAQAATEADKRRAREQAALRARIADQNRQLSVTEAQQALDRTIELNRQELAAFKGTGAQRLALVKRQAEDEYQARLRVADALRDKEVREAQNRTDLPAATRQRLIDAANGRYNNAELVARGQRDATIQQAQEQQAETVRRLRSEYSKLAESIRAQVAAGEFGADQQHEATKAFNLLGQAAAAAGLTTNKHMELARKSVWGLITTGADLSTTLNLIASGVARVGENGELLYATDDELRGIGVAAEDAAGDFFDLQNAIDGVGMLSRDELGQLIEQAGLAEDAAEALWAAWNRINEGLTGGPIEFGDNLAGRGIQNEPDAFDPATGNMAEGEAENLARAFWGQPIEELRSVFASLSQKDTPLGNLLQGAIKAQELLSRLEVAVDPVEIQGITAEIAEFMASDMGKALPPTIGGALEAGVKDADSYREILATATAEGIRDGFDRAADAGSGPQNRFAEFSETLWGMGDALKDPVTLEAVTGELEKARQAGELTTAELTLLKQIIDSINGTPIEIGLTDDERRFEEVSERANRIVADFEAGAISAEEFASQLGPVTHQMERMAAMAEAQGKHDLAALYRDIAAGLRNMIPPLAQATEEVATLGQGLDDLGRGFAAVLDAFGLSEWGKLSSAAAGLFKTFEQGRASLQQIGPAFAKSFGAGLSAVGSFLGVVASGINLIGQIGDAILNLSPAFQAWRKNLLEVADAQKKVAGEQVGMFKNPYSASLLEDAAKRENLANAGFWKRVWWGISGTAPKVLSDEAAKLQIAAAEIFGELGQTISGAIESGLMNAFETGDWTGVEAAFEKSLNTLVAKMALQAILASSKMEEKLKAYSDARAEAMKDGSISADEQKQLDEHMAGIRAEYQSIQESWKATAPGLAGFGQGAGPAGSIAALQGEISKLQNQLNLATTDAERERLRSEIEAKQKELTRLSGEAEAAAGSIAALQNRISALQAEYNATTSQAERDRLRAEIESLQRSLSVMNGESPTELTAPSLKTVKVDMPQSITSTLNFDVLSTLSSSVLSLAQVLPPTITQFGGYVGQFGANVDRMGRLLTRAETDWGALR
ncbi:hypothetical protein RDMS_01535 [Deinococcus sp. RL]|uniref:phage tail tape measure protein n=1 Tax=Deinococcus sp. RL TaxID=1489678 RepID=UPI0004DA6328|nr:phage tail tape measure protein [Deinococcus sp. RL]KEF35463.1 hypothetical protein RDMS_01535 [Deinococcus sp. RL]